MGLKVQSPPCFLLSLHFLRGGLQSGNLQPRHPGKHPQWHLKPKCKQFWLTYPGLKKRRYSAPYPMGIRPPGHQATKRLRRTVFPGYGSRCPQATPLMKREAAAQVQRSRSRSGRPTYAANQPEDCVAHEWLVADKLFFPPLPATLASGCEHRHAEPRLGHLHCTAPVNFIPDFEQLDTPVGSPTAVLADSFPFIIMAAVIRMLLGVLGIELWVPELPNAPERTPSAYKQEKAARIIQRAWKTFVNVAVFQHFKSLIDLRCQGEPRQIVRYINPKEAELLDAAAGIQVRFRLGGVKFPPEIYYKIFTHRPIEDLCANSPKDYTNLPARYTSHNKDDPPQVEDRSGWYRRVENNGWRPVSHRFWIPIENQVLESKKESEFHFSKLKRKQDMEKKRKIKKVEWMRQMYYMGSLEAKAAHQETLGLIHKATKGLIKTIEHGGIDSVMEWEVDEVLKWTNTLNFDEYIAHWKEIATSNSSANLKDAKLERIQKSLYHAHGDGSEAGIDVNNERTNYENVYYKRPQFTSLKSDSTFGM
ncbi:protein MFI [Acomys russatus]|uniref:protein MFI n=1 Tax=Acomys russatus TaxID=60746 RepID=UPI0021E28FA1|nr:protein MFI [Acomys russatus]